MDKDRDVEAWADALLDAHRSAPPRTWSSPEEAERALSSLPLVHRMAIKRSGQMPDPDQIERFHRNASRFERLEKAGSIFTIAGVVVLTAIAMAFYSGF